MVVSVNSLLYIFQKILYLENRSVVREIVKYGFTLIKKIATWPIMSHCDVEESSEGLS
jgi:hypothetical protein